MRHLAARWQRESLFTSRRKRSLEARSDNSASRHLGDPPQRTVLSPRPKPELEYSLPQPPKPGAQDPPAAATLDPLDKSLLTAHLTSSDGLVDGLDFNNRPCLCGS